MPVITRGVVWYRKYIEEILSNGLVIGTLTPHCNVRVGTKLHSIPLDPAKGYYPAIIPLKVYDRAQQIISLSGKGRKATIVLKNILAYVTKCTVCGTSMRRYVHNNEKGWVYLTCTNNRNGKGCSYTSFPYKRLESVFLKVLRKSLFKFPVGNKQATEVDQRLLEERRKLKGLKTGKYSILMEIDVVANSTSNCHDKLAQQLIIQVREIETVERKISNLLIEHKESLPDMVNVIRKELIEEMNNETPRNERLNLLIRGLFSKVELYKEAMRNVRFVATYKTGPVLECHYDDSSYQWRYLE